MPYGCSGNSCTYFRNLSSAVDHLEFTSIEVAAQKSPIRKSGAFTGDLGRYVKECWCRHRNFGHSERRAIFHETVDS
jgi:triosephosphate isomerase